MAAGTTYSTIATTTLSSAAASYTFSSIPSTYTDLILVSYIKAATADQNCALQFNGDTASNYSITNIDGSGTASGSSRLSNQSNMILDNYAYMTTAIFKTTISHIQNYSNATTYKTILSRASNASSSPSAGVDINVGLWRSTAAINSIKLLGQQGTSNFAIGSTFTLYGIACA
jgi:hypothetical protein